MVCSMDGYIKIHNGKSRESLDLKEIDFID